MNLLNLWRLNESSEIKANKLFKLAGNRFERALGFHSLLSKYHSIFELKLYYFKNSILDLSKKHFVILTTFPGTIALQNIAMGKAVKKSSNMNQFKV